MGRTNPHRYGDGRPAHHLSPDNEVIDVNLVFLSDPNDGHDTSPLTENIVQQQIHKYVRRDSTSTLGGKHLPSAREKVCVNPSPGPITTRKELTTALFQLQNLLVTEIRHSRIPFQTNVTV